MDLTLHTAEEFDTLAAKLFNEYELNINGNLYKFHEIEFYLHSAAHPDPYVHKNPAQMEVGTWYFHMTGKGYKGGTFKGLDITFGAGVYGGILIRAITSHDGVTIEGPSLVVDRILQECKSASVTDFVRDYGRESVMNHPRLSIVPAVSAKQIYTARRVGLNPATAPDYWAAPYRYFVEPAVLKKDRDSIKNGLAKNHGFDETEIKKILAKVK